MRSVLFAAAMMISAVPALAEEANVYHLTIKDHHFVPDMIEAPADARLILIVKNEDATPEEFDSTQLRREKVIPAGKEITILVGPLKPGSYKFAGEYHEDSAKGVLVVK